MGETDEADRETVVIVKRGGGGLVAAAAVVIALVAILHYLDLLPF
jgi:hypothetical protein